MTSSSIESPTAAAGTPSVAKDSHTFDARDLTLRALVELFGSFLIIFALYSASTWSSVLGLVSGSSSLPVVILVTAGAYCVVTAIFGRISGGHFNPAVTIAAVLTSKLSWIDGIAYIVAQVLGGIAAAGLLVGILPTSSSIPTTFWLQQVVNGFDKGSVSVTQTSGQLPLNITITTALVVELLASLIVVATAMTTLDDDGRPNSRQATYMGLAYGLGAGISYSITGASMNPARSTGIAIFAQNRGLSQQPMQQLWVFWICPVLAATIVALAIILVRMFLSGTSQTTEAGAEDAGESDDTEDVLDESASDPVGASELGEASQVPDAGPAKSGSDAKVGSDETPGDEATDHDSDDGADDGLGTATVTVHLHKQNDADDEGGQSDAAGDADDGVKGN